MTLLSRKTDYALLILSDLHQRAEGGCAREIADRFRLSRAFVANILKELCQKGFVASHRGVKGGYALQRPLGDITLAEVLLALEDKFRLTSCTGTHSPVMDEDCSLHLHCPIKGPMAEVHARMMDMFGKVNLADLLEPQLPTTTFQAVLSTLPMREACAAGI